MWGRPSNAYIERVVRNLCSAGDKFNFTHPLGGGIGRIATSGFYLPGIAVHKVLGAGFYGLSVLCSGVAFGLSKTSYGKQLQSIDFDQINKQRKDKKGFFNKSLYSVVSTSLEKSRTALFNRLIQATNKPDGKANSWVRSIARYYTKNSEQTRYPEGRRYHSNYMWKNLHEYGPLTQGLMKASYNTLLWVNRLGGSFDKYFGSFLAKNGLKQSLGEVLGNRVGLLIGIGISAGLSIFIAPLAIGTSYVAAMACGLSLLLLLAAKANVIYNNDWYGSSSKPIPFKRVC